jgi:hypothetical protein
MHLSPAATGLLQASLPASMAVLALCAQPVSTRIGMPAGILCNILAQGRTNVVAVQRAMQAGAAATSFADRVDAYPAGRVQTILLARGIGVVCQGLMALKPELWPVAWIMVPIILFRIGALNVHLILSDVLGAENLRSIVAGKRSMSVPHCASVFSSVRLHLCPLTWGGVSMSGLGCIC